MAAWFEWHSEMICSVLMLDLGGDAAPGEFIALLPQHLDGFGTKGIPAVRKARGFWNPYTVQFELDQGKLAGEPVCVSRDREGIMCPAMISNFKTHLVNL